MAADIPAGSALGLLETHGLVAAVEAADAMLKASAVRLVRQEKTVPALITHVVVGDTAAVQSAVDAGVAAAARVGRVASAHVIPSPSDDVWRVLLGAVPGQALPLAPPASATFADSDPDPNDPPPATAPAAGDDYDDQTVRELRVLARDRDDDRLSGRAISAASKDELVAFLRESEPPAGG